MGVTNHWFALIAHKINGKHVFYLFDSKNEEYLNWNETNIQQKIEEIDSKR